MNHADLAITGLLLASMLIGIVRGFTREFLSVFSWASSGFLTYLTYPIVQTFLKHKIQNPMLVDILSGIITFACFLLLFGIVSHLLANWIQNSLLGGLDRSLGLLFGVIRGVGIVCLLEIVLSCFISRLQYPQGLFVPYVLQLSDTLLNTLPPHIKIFLIESRKSGGIETAADMQKTVERLSQLQPKAASDSKNPSVNSLQEGKINRLINAQENPDKAEEKIEVEGGKEAQKQKVDKALEGLLDDDTSE